MSFIQGRQIAIDFRLRNVTYRQATHQYFKEDLMMSNPFYGTATDANFENEVVKSDKPVVVDFWAPWCGPCKALAPVFEEIAEKYQDRLKFMKLNVDDAQKTAVNYGVRGIPTVILFKNGNVLDTLVGLVSKERLEDFVKKAL
jgi:thioredoxin 1